MGLMNEVSVFAKGIVPLYEYYSEEVYEAVHDSYEEAESNDSS